MSGHRMIRMAGATVVVLALVGTACGKSGGTGSGGSTSSAGNQTSAPATTGATSSAGATVSAKNVSGLGMVLVDSRGFTLYRLTGETSSHFLCDASCTPTWPPVEASGTPKAGPGATGTLGTAMRPDGGTQVTYDGIPLYTFSGDSGPGQSNGEGIQGVWFAVTPAGQSAKGGSGGGGGASPTGGGGYHGY